MLPVDGVLSQKYKNLKSHTMKFIVMTQKCSDD
jgi:hypothetical protein